MISDEMLNRLERDDYFETENDWKILSEGYLTPGQQQDRILGQMITKSLIQEAIE